MSIKLVLTLENMFSGINDFVFHKRHTYSKGLYRTVFTRIWVNLMVRKILKMYEQFNEFDMTFDGEVP